MYGKVFVDGLRVCPVMPVMKLWRGEEPAQRAEVEAHIRMDERCLQRDHDHVGQQRALAESQNVERKKDDGPGGNRVHQMKSRAREPVHGFRRVMHGVEAPQRWPCMEGAMHPVL